MELFTVKNRKSLEVLKGFPNKMDAKKFRDSLIDPKQKEEQSKTGNFDFIVSKGVDHVKN
jgi:U3 small nucleolar ribonucleoprotein component